MAVVFDNNVNITVEIAFDSNPLDSSQTWTDVSQYLRSFEIPSCHPIPSKVA